MYLSKFIRGVEGFREVEGRREGLPSSVKVRSFRYTPGKKTHR